MEDNINTIINALYKKDDARLEIGNDIVFDFSNSKNIFKYINTAKISSNKVWVCTLAAISRDIMNMCGHVPVYDYELVSAFYNIIQNIDHSMIDILCKMTTNPAFQNNDNAVLGFIYHIFFNRARLSMKDSKVASLTSSFRHMMIGARCDSKLSGEHFWYRLYELQTAMDFEVTHARLDSLYLSYTVAGELHKRLNGCLVGVSPTFLLLMWSAILMELRAETWEKSGGHGGSFVINNVQYSYNLFYNVECECLITGYVTHASRSEQ